MTANNILLTLSAGQFVEFASEQKIKVVQIYGYKKVVILSNKDQELSVSIIDFPKYEAAELIHFLSQAHFAATELSDMTYKISATLILCGGVRMRSIHRAAINGDIALLEDALARKVPDRYSVDVVYLAPSSNRGTALQLACNSNGSQNFVQIVDKLVKAGADVNSTAARNPPPLALAMKKNNFAIAARLVEAAANVNCRVEVRADGAIKDVTPLQIACRAEQLELVKQMVAKGAKVNETGTADVAFNEEDSWYSPLAEAARAKNIPIARVLIAAKATCSIVTEVTRKREYNAAQKSTIQSIDTKRIDFNEWACWRINLDFLKLLVEAKVEYHFLHKAAKFGNEPAIEYLLSQRLAIDEYDEKNATPLAVALQEKKLSAASLLLDKGANPLKITITIRAGFDSDAEHLLETHKVQARSMHAISIPQMIFPPPAAVATLPPSSDLLNGACERGDLGAVQAALNSGLQPDSRTLTFACKSGRIDIVDPILAKGAPHDDETLTVACATNNLALVLKMITHGCKATKQTIEVARQTKNYEIINAILNLVSQSL